MMINMNDQKKFHLKCKRCGGEIEDFYSWFKFGQRCPECSSDYVWTVYQDGQLYLKRSLINHELRMRGLWRYFNVLPLTDPENIVSSGEGDVDVQRWPFLELLARKYFQVDCNVFAHRHDNNPSTGTFKDLSGSVVASVLKENKIGEYVVASTGNIGVSFSRYLSAAGITLYPFIPSGASNAQEAEISCFGQAVYRVKGDYTRAKEVALEFAEKHGFLVAFSSCDPLRVEAKKTMAFEWLLRMDRFPTVYIQAISGGTGPLGVIKGCEELKNAGLIDFYPRQPPPRDIQYLFCMT